ncbi:MAG TPA: DUF1223 domain-containing protein [Burkholderiales bacterium]|nr:DUF1223 domain-containing protein [Burkholderiales bacterium]
MKSIGNCALVAALWAACVFAAPAHAGAECRFESPQHRVALLELYTSEGCSSCPPADQWFSRLRAQGIDADSAVLLAFHVDYWNELGWPDPYSQPAFTARQRGAAPRASRGIVYTPQLLLDGLDYRPGAPLRQPLSAIKRQPPGARIRASVQRDAAEVHVRGEVDNLTGGSPAQVWMAVYENGLFTHVRAGENAGKRLNHDFVVRDLVGPVALTAGSSARLDHRLKVGADAQSERLGVAIFVERPQTGNVVQAATLYPLCS